MQPDYARTLNCKGNRLDVTVIDDASIATYNGREVVRRVGDVGLLVFNVKEDGQAVVYDIAVLHSKPMRTFVGRNGKLIYSDDQAFAMDLTGDL